MTTKEQAQTAPPAHKEDGSYQKVKGSNKQYLVTMVITRATEDRRKVKIANTHSRAQKSNQEEGRRSKSNNSRPSRRQKKQEQHQHSNRQKSKSQLRKARGGLQRADPTFRR
jgi:hypothetical protein